MKKIIIACASFIVVASSVAFTKATKAGEPVSYTVDAKNSKVDFSGSKKGGYHPGYFPVKDGSVMVANGKITGGRFTIDVAGIKVTDASGEKLESHLKATDFLDASKFADATFEIKSVKYKNAETAVITGDLSLKGATSKISFETKVREISDTKLFAEANFSIDRTKFGINYGVGNVSSDVQIGVHLFASK